MVVVIKKGANKQEIKKAFEKLNKSYQSNLLNLKKFLGVLNLKEAPLEIQKKLRDEWE